VEKAGELLTSTANPGCGRLDGLELTLGASLVGAVAETVAEVRVLAETGDVAVGAAKVLCLVEHVVDTGALGSISIVRSIYIHIIPRVVQLTPHSGTSLKSWAYTAAARRRTG